VKEIFLSSSFFSFLTGKTFFIHSPCHVYLQTFDWKIFLKLFQVGKRVFGCTYIFLAASAAAAVGIKSFPRFYGYQ